MGTSEEGRRREPGEDDDARRRGPDEIDDEARGSTGLDDDEARGGAGEDGEVTAAQWQPEGSSGAGKDDESGRRRGPDRVSEDDEEGRGGAGEDDEVGAAGATGVTWTAGGRPRDAAAVRGGGGAVRRVLERPKTTRSGRCGQGSVGAEAPARRATTTRRVVAHTGEGRPGTHARRRRRTRVGATSI
ncbi:hypothetical protein PVAP13_7NG296156 [Panicum virgatum]|uniref:Uncharacterized protein n=1 Tax=Panicum virgatum TaxID=38727 RepID=A0A8T0PUF5_PANVG|nr:hypothetical protein PVAP13_7NG296156 [Panicum virgatum]